MDDAIDTIRNQRVRAAQASVYRFPDQYICPVCRTEVTLAWGDIQRKHFKHIVGTDHDECERYSNNFGRDIPLSQHEYEHLDAVMVATQAPTRDGTQVLFAVRFRPAKSHGLAKLTGQVEFVLGEHTTTYIIQPTLRQQFFPITSPEKNYLIRARTRRGGQIPYPVEGFDKKPAVFRATDGEAVRIPDHRLLKPGRYIVVTPKPIRNLHVALGAQRLLTLRGLDAILIQIPDDPTYQLREHIRSVLGFDIATKVAVYGFLSPANVYEIAPDCWEISKDAELAILIKVYRDGGLIRFTRLLVQQRTAGHLTTDFLPWDSDLEEFVVTIKPRQTRPELYRFGLTNSIGNPVSFLLDVKLSDETLSPQCSRIQFQFASGSSAKTRLKWSAHELPKTIADAARGFGKLQTISIPPEPVQMSVSDSGGQRALLPRGAAADKLLAFLRSAKFPCVLTASGHPDIFLRSGKAIVHQPTEAKAPVRILPRSRREARLLDGYRRGCVSDYAIRCIP